MFHSTVALFPQWSTCSFTQALPLANVLTALRFTTLELVQLWLLFASFGQLQEIAGSGCKKTDLLIRQVRSLNSEEVLNSTLEIMPTVYRLDMWKH